jgi:large subunit ribosomal protein L9
MEVLLMADVADLGSEGEVVNVADGYARNRLFPGKLAAPVTEATKRRLAKIRQDRETARKLQLDEARDLAAKLEKASCTITVKAGGDGKLFGSVNTGTIADALKAQGIVIDKNTLVLDAPIKELGVFDIKVKLHAEVEGVVKVWVVEE